MQTIQQMYDKVQWHNQLHNNMKQLLIRPILAGKIVIDMFSELSGPIFIILALLA